MVISEFVKDNDILTAEDLAKISYMTADNADLIKRILLLKYGNIALDYDDVVVLDVQTDIYTVFQMHSYNWTKKYTTIQVIYDALDNINISETGTDTNTGADTESGTDSTTGSGSNTGTVANSDNDSVNSNNTNIQSVKRNNFDASGLVENENTTTTDEGSQTGIKTSNRTDDLHSTSQNSIQYGHVVDKNNTLSYDHKRTGYDGQSPQDAIQKERNIAEYNFFEMIADEIITYICTLEYQF